MSITSPKYKLIPVTDYDIRFVDGSSLPLTLRLQGGDSVHDEDHSFLVFRFANGETATVNVENVLYLSQRQRTMPVSVNEVYPLPPVEWSEPLS